MSSSEWSRKSLVWTVEKSSGFRDELDYLLNLLFLLIPAPVAQLRPQVWFLGTIAIALLSGTFIKLSLLFCSLFLLSTCQSFTADS